MLSANIDSIAGIAGSEFLKPYKEGIIDCLFLLEHAPHLIFNYTYYFLKSLYCFSHKLKKCIFKRLNSCGRKRKMGWRQTTLFLLISIDIMVYYVTVYDAYVLVLPKLWLELFSIETL